MVNMECIESILSIYQFNTYLLELQCISIDVALVYRAQAFY